MKRYSATGIILRRIDYSEADRIITFLSAEHGKIRVIAKGVRKQKSKMAGGIELFSVSELHCIKGKSEIDTLTSTRLIINYGNIVKDLDRTEVAYRLLKVINKTVEDNTGEEYFDILNETLASLDNQKISSVLSEASFIMRMLQNLGHVPQFSVDSSGKELSESSNYDFDFEAVSFKESNNGQYNKNHLKVLKLLAHNSPQKMASVQGVISLCGELDFVIKGLGNSYLPGMQ